MGQFTHFKKLGRIPLAHLILLPCVVLLMGADGGCPLGTGASAPNASCATPVTVKVARGDCAPVPAGRCFSGSTELNNVEYDFQSSGLPPGITLQTGGPFADFPHWSGVEVCAALDAPVSPFPFTTPVVTIPYTGTSGGAWGTGSVDVIVYSLGSIGSPVGLSATLSGPTSLPAPPQFISLDLHVSGCGQAAIDYCNIYWSDGSSVSFVYDGFPESFSLSPTQSTTVTAVVVGYHFGVPQDYPILSTTATHTIVVGSPPPLSVSVTATPESIQRGDWSQLNATVSGGLPPYSFSWSPPVALSALGTSDPVATPDQTTNYTLTVTDAANRTFSQSVTVYVAPNPPSVSIYVDPATLPLVPGLSTQLKALIVGGTPPFTYSWSPSDTLSAPNIWNPIASPSVTTTYTLLVKDALGLQATKTVTVYTPLTASVLATPAIIDPGGHSQLHAAAYGGVPPYNFLWGSDPTLSPTSIFTTDPVATPKLNTFYFVTVTDAVGQSFGPLPVLVKVRLAVTASATPSTITSGGTSQLNAVAAGGAGGYTYSWSPATGLSATNIANPTAKPTVTTAYFVNATDQAGASASTSTTVSVLNPTGLSACFKIVGGAAFPGTPVKFDASCSSGSIVLWEWWFNWNPAAPSTVPDQSGPSLVMPTYTYNCANCFSATVHLVVTDNTGAKSSVTLAFPLL